MLRILFIIFLSIATLLTAAAWWFIYVRRPIETDGFSLFLYPAYGSFLGKWHGSFVAFLNVWLLTVVTALSWAAYPFVSVRLIRRRRRKRGLCVKCGYDLTGNESGVCAECGTEVKA